MGLVKGFIPHMEWFNYRALLGLGSTFGSTLPLYARIYGIGMAALEILSSILLQLRARPGYQLALITLIVNSAGCAIAVILGDWIALFILLLRLIGILILVKAKNQIANCAS